MVRGGITWGTRLLNSEVTKLRSYETTKLRNYKVMERRRCETTLLSLSWLSRAKPKKSVEFLLTLPGGSTRRLAPQAGNSENPMLLRLGMPRTLRLDSKNYLQD
jgi:hypothetical protein